MNRTPIKGSSQIKSVGHDATTKKMQIEFVNGKTYEYEQVPASQAKALIEAESAGKYFNAAIKGNYIYTQVKEDGSTN